MMTRCFFVSDLHGKTDRYGKLFHLIENEAPDAVFIGGDILPSPGVADEYGDFIGDFLAVNLRRLREKIVGKYPRIFIIPGNDDYRSVETELESLDNEGLLTSLHGRAEPFSGWKVFGYSFTPPSPFLLKDWEKYDVSRYIDPGCVSPEEGYRTVSATIDEVRYGTISADLEDLAGSAGMENAIFLFHAPPYRTALDRAGLDGRSIDGIAMDVNVGSIAIRRFIEDLQPLLTLHGHIHESARLTGSWKDRLGRTLMFSAAHDGPELALVRFDPDDPAAASRELV
ncbi:MAG TPA: hypothetical protein ENO08_08050 [Candidatus Eisenbacteria bacterium]|uniref:Calcineurin-like phosphoesterase domain-containing protein n=1 Tax=Eiseniibacteriota bacterium TaxID=2212470 RepID=A0A7V2AW88_UNCEI|nr:hypothetical protein [Candidatus Eisenbacteria bacterium]